MNIIPGFQNGFARNAPESKHPNLWMGLQLLYAPYIGNTGTIIKDWSGNFQDGVYSGGSAADWLVEDSSLSLKMIPGYRVLVNSMALGTIATISVRATFPSGNNKMLWIINGGAPGPDLFFVNGYIALNTWDGAANWFCPQPPDAEKYHEYTTVISPNDTALYIDGIFAGIASYRDPSGSPFHISSSSFWWTGNVSRAAVWDRVLAASEITQYAINRYAPLELNNYGFTYGPAGSGRRRRYQSYAHP